MLNATLLLYYTCIYVCLCVNKMLKYLCKKILFVHVYAFDHVHACICSKILNPFSINCVLKAKYNRAT